MLSEAVAPFAKPSTARVIKNIRATQNVGMLPRCPMASYLLARRDSPAPTSEAVFVLRGA